MRILIAEDEVTIARALKVMLEKSKYAVDMVHNGNDALDYIPATAYDALVLDIMMPGKDGIEVLKAVRGSGNTTPTLFLTAKAEEMCIRDRISRDTPYRIRFSVDAAADVPPELPGKLPIDGLPAELPLPPFCAFSSVCWVLSEAS